MVTRVTIDHGALSRLLTRISSTCAGKAADRTADRVRANIAAAGRIRTGNMLRSVQKRPISLGTRSSYEVYSLLSYTVYQEEGIGPVHARPGGFLVFTPKGSDSVVFAKRTRGFPGGHFFRDAHSAIRLTDFL